MILKRIFKCICFLLCFVLFFAGLNGILVRKNLVKPWDMTTKIHGFYNEPNNTFDVMYFGSSHMYCSIDPIQVKELTGLNSYIFATQQQPLWVTYYYMKEALKTQSPETMVVEVNMAKEKEDFMDEGTNYSALDDIPFSMNKWDMIKAAAPEGQRRFYLFNFYKYHGRWEELTKEDFDKTYLEKRDPLQGFVRLEQSKPVVHRDDLTSVTESTMPTEKNLEYLNKIIALSEDEGFRLILYKSPSNATVEEEKIYNAVGQLAEEQGITYVDYNQLYAKLGLDLNTDFFDESHLNYLGVAKLTPDFVQYLTQPE